jgi:hypothetical protein
MPCNSGPGPDSPFDVEGALCDVLSTIEDRYPHLLRDVDACVIHWWQTHEKLEQKKIREEALKKLTPRERRALGHK